MAEKERDEERVGGRIPTTTAPKDTGTAKGISQIIGNLLKCINNAETIRRGAKRLIEVKEEEIRRVIADL
jgi:hypothetical protein